jgi:hypothetical protein
MPAEIGAVLKPGRKRISRVFVQIQQPIMTPVGIGDIELPRR